ncbi:hypothetical protein F5Y16DRAFT_374068 [Xylariaceae sp. FL0255]|nr:hypothetical protein F5Y16DRAFT_374068 [Xylariaceae sp. FL0255]
MVGLPRSRGCLNCRRSKKSCPLEPGACSRCISKGLECGGYERERVFLHHDQNTEANSITVTYRKQQVKPPSPPSSFSPALLPLSTSMKLAQTAFVDNYIGLFLSNYLPTGIPTHTSRWSRQCSWIEEAYNQHRSARVLELSLLSLGLYTAGEPKLALKTYGLALAQLNSALGSRNGPKDNYIFAACKFMCLFEVFHGDSNDKVPQSYRWFGHTRGQAAILASRGPCDYQSGLSHQLFLDTRYPLLILAVSTRQRFQFNTAEWRTLPWAQNPKSQHEKLLDILADLTEILADTDQMRACESAIADGHLSSEDLVASCYKLDDTLRKWFLESVPLKEFQDVGGTVNGPLDGEDINFAHSTILFWTTTLILHATMASLLNIPMSECPSEIDPKPYLRKLAIALPYFWTPMAGSRGTSMAAFPLGAAFEVAQSAPAHFAFELALLIKLITRTDGQTIKKFLSSIQKTTAGLALTGSSHEVPKC